jgi:hypothetical protein
MDKIKKAVFHKDLRGFRGNASLYEMIPALPYKKYDADEGKYVKRKARFVVVSAALDRPLGVCETFLFPADSEGKVTSWGELPGSESGIYSAEEIFSGIGYVTYKPCEE